MSTLLTEAELQELSDYKQGAKQVKFLLQAYGLNVPRRRDGRVRVTWDAAIVTSDYCGQPSIKVCRSEASRSASCANSVYAVK